MHFSKINTIVLSGGGVKGFGFIGFFKALYSVLSPDNIVHFIGASIGSLFNFVIASGYSLDEITSIALQYDFTTLLPALNLDNLIFDLGLSDGLNLKKLLIELLVYKFNVSDITFIEHFEKTGKQLTFVVSNITSQQIEYWNYLSVPSHSIIDGILASTRLPLFFQPFQLNNSIYMDGSIVNNYPINLVPLSDIDTVIGCYIHTLQDIDDIKSIFKMDTDLKTIARCNQFLKYIYYIMSFTFQSKIDLLHQSYLNHTVFIEHNCSNFMDLTITTNIKQYMIDYAFDKTISFIEKNKIAIETEVIKTEVLKTEEIKTEVLN